MSTSKLKNLLNPSGNGELGSLVRRARAIGALTDELARALPAECAESLVAASVQDGELVIVTRSPAWAARLRFEEEALLGAAQSLGEAVTRFSVRVSHT